MNHCRICNKIIPDRFNGGPALRCSRCRKIQDEQLSEMIAETSGLDEENEYLRSRFFDTETEYQKLNRKHHKMKKRYDILRGKHCSDLKKIDNLETENERLRKGIERLFAKINELDGKSKIEDFIS